MSRKVFDPNDPFYPVNFAERYTTKPIEVQYDWIKAVEVKGFLDHGDLVMEMIGLPAVTGPNAYGKTVLFRLIKAVLDIATGKPARELHDTVATIDRFVESLKDGGNIPVYKYGRLFDSITVINAADEEFTLVTDDAESGQYMFMYKTELGEGNRLVNISSDVITPSNPVVFMDVFWLPANRMSFCGKYIYQAVQMSEGKIDYDLLNRWYNYLFWGDKLDDPPKRIRYKDIPTDSVDNIYAWVVKNHLTHGEVELLLLSTAMTSGAPIVMIDEAEAGLHMSVQLEYMKLITEFYKRNVQALFTTNSPETFDMIWSSGNDLFELLEEKPSKEE